MYIYDKNCIPTIKAVSMTAESGVLYITLPEKMTLINGKKWRLLICQN